MEQINISKLEQIVDANLLVIKEKEYELARLRELAQTSIIKLDLMKKELLGEPTQELDMHELMIQDVEMYDDKGVNLI